MAKHGFGGVIATAGAAAILLSIVSTAFTVAVAVVVASKVSEYFPIRTAAAVPAMQIFK